MTTMRCDHLCDCPAYVIALSPSAEVEYVIPARFFWCVVNEDMFLFPLNHEHEQKSCNPKISLGITVRFGQRQLYNQLGYSDFNLGYISLSCRTWNTH
jgi:hypothetical protein